MDTALLGIRLLLFVVFLVAGIAKLVDLQGSRQSMINFGLPAVLANPMGLLLPLAELIVAIALVPVASAWWGAVGALILLLLFIVVIGITLARGHTPDCHCFGQLHSEPVGWQTLARNGVLATAASFVVWQGYDNSGPNVLKWIGNLTSAQAISLFFGIAMLAVLVVEGWLMLNLMRQNGRLLLRMDELEARLNSSGIAAMPAPAQSVAGLPVGSPAPAFELPLVSGGTLTLDVLRAKAKPVLLIFSDPGCGPCTALLPDISHWQRQYADKLTLALISRGTLEANQAKSAEYTLLQKDREVAEAYKCHGTPGAVLVRPDHTIGSSLAMGADAIKALVVRAAGTLAPLPTGVVANGSHKGAAMALPVPSGLKVGEHAPSVILPALSGSLINLAELQGRNTLILFWNPNCGYCTRMLVNLKDWESHTPKGAPQLLVVSTGSVEVNQAMGLRSPVVIDQGFTAGRFFGATGTPSSVLVDAKGKIASEVAVGAPAVLALLGVRPGQLKQADQVLVVR